MTADTPPASFASLHEIKDETILLSLGKAFLCEEAFLKKIGHSMEESLEPLREEILALKRSYVGQFVEEVDTEGLLEKLQSQAALLQNPDKGLTDRCTVGTLGVELEEAVRALTDAIKAIQSKVEGDPGRYTKKDSLVEGAKAAGGFVSSWISLGVKVGILLLLVALGPLLYLGVTMERVGSLEKQIVESRAVIRSQQEKIAAVRKERDELTARVESSNDEGLSREQRLERMDVSIKMHGLDQTIHKAEAEIAKHERNIRLSQQKIQQIQSKTFLQRLFRR